MEKNRLLRLKGLLVVMLTTFSMSAMANNDYYSKTVAKVAKGEGKVYVSYASLVDEDACVYEAESSAESGADNQSSAPSHTYYLYAQAGEDYKFAGWYATEDCSGEPTSTDNPYGVSITANTDVNNATQTFYAKFDYVDPTLPHFEFGQEHIYINIDAEPAVPDGLLVKNVTATATSSNTAVVEVDEVGTLTPKAPGTARVTLTAEGYEDMVFLVTVINNVEAGVTQIGNGDFEDWRGVTSSNHAPDNWNSFETAEGTFASMTSAQQVAMVEGGRPGTDGLYCADIYSRNVIGSIIAQGNLTLGCINAGAMTAADAANHNFSKISDPSKSETISKVPSALKAWVRFVPGATNVSYPYARISATVHDEYNYITYGSSSNDNDENKAHAIAQAELNFTACDWTEVTIPFVATGNTTDGQMYIIVNFTTNAEPGQGQEGDHLYIDDVELVYPEESEPVVYEKYIQVAVSGTYTDPQPASIEVTYNDDSTIDFNLKNFTLDTNGTPNYVGNIALSGLAIDEDGNFSFNGNIQITEGDKEGVETWIGPMLGEIPIDLNGTIKDDYFYGHIDIEIGYSVKVDVGDLANATVAVSDALVGTFCAPFTVAIPAAYQSAVTASTVKDVDGNVLVLEPVEGGVIPANTPVIIESTMAASLPVSGIYVKGTPVYGLLTGVYEATAAPVGSYVLQDIDEKVGFYQVAAGSQPTVGANRAYLTTASGVKAFYFGEDDATAIKGLNEAEDAQNIIFNVAGQRIQKMQRGINIINGKKILK